MRGGGVNEESEREESDSLLPRLLEGDPRTKA
jgi:hypothetical protein